MARVKSSVLRAVSDAHLRAIGKVSAEWNDLELVILYSIAKTINLSLSHTAILVASQNVRAWCDILKRLTRESRSYNKKSPATELDKLCDEIDELQKKRNQIVHASWHLDQSQPGLLGGLMNPAIFSAPPKPKAATKVTGIGVPKRGAKPFIDVEMTTKDMLAVAKSIQAIQLKLSAWLARRQQRLRIADALLENQIPQNQNPMHNALRVRP